MTETSPNGLVQLSISERVAEIRLAHPEKVNCFSMALAEDFSDHLTTIDERDDISVILITAEGPVFSGGADTDVLSQGSKSERDRLSSLLLDEICHYLHETTTPVVAAARGAATGAGATVLCYSADMQVVSPSVEIWWPEVEFGAAPLGRAVYLASQIGESRTLKLMLLGSEGKLSAKEALELGAVTMIVNEDEVDIKGRELASTIAKHDESNPGIIEAFIDAVQKARQEAYGTTMEYAHCREEFFG